MRQTEHAHKKINNVAQLLSLLIVGQWLLRTYNNKYTAHTVTETIKKAMIELIKKNTQKNWMWSHDEL